MSITVRWAIPQDEPAVQRVGEAAFDAVRQVYQPRPATIQQVSQSAPAMLRLVAEEDGQIVGTVRYRIDGDLLRVIGLGVLPTSQRRGIARQLIDRLAALARDHRCRALALYTITQTGNVPIFRALGFEVLTESPDEHCISPTHKPLTESYMERPI